MHSCFLITTFNTPHEFRNKEQCCKLLGVCLRLLEDFDTLPDGLGQVGLGLGGRF